MVPKHYKKRALRALDDVEDGMSVQGAAEKNDIDRCYLRRRILGTPTALQSYQVRQTLSVTQEAYLVRWALDQAAIGYAAPLKQFKHFAMRLLALEGMPQKLGRRWYERFLRRHPEIRTSKSRLIEYKRYNGACKANIDIFFERLTSLNAKKLRPENIWNVDECGVAEGLGHNSFVVPDALRDFTLKKDGARRTWITIIEAISASGAFIPPLVIFKGQSVQQQWFPDVNLTKWQKWHFETSPNGWTSNDIALKWLKELFIPHTKPADPEEWRCLILDGHKSHSTVEFMSECFTNKIWLLFLPAHTSHVLQPLDVGVFSAVLAGALSVDSASSDTASMSWTYRRTSSSTPSANT